MLKKVYICHDTREGIFSAVYDAWIERREGGEAGIAFYGEVETELFCEYVETSETAYKAKAVEKMIWKNLGKEAYGRIYQAVKAKDTAKGTAIFQMLVEARKLSDSTRIMEHLTASSVKKVWDLSRAVGNETHFFKEVLRFKELESGILYAKIEPQHRILEGVAPHFEDRLPMEHWVIYDASHEEFAIHEAGKRWTLVQQVAADHTLLQKVSEEERDIQRLWKQFFCDISVKERESKRRQMSHLPLKYRKNMVEFEC